MSLPLPPLSLYLSCFCCLNVLFSAETSKLNAPKLLLPYSAAAKVNFTLEAEEGCYAWRSSRVAAVLVEPVFVNGTPCSRSAVVSALSTQPSRLASGIVAEEMVTGRVLRCSVVVDVICSIEIVSTTRELYVDDSPLELSVRALDQEGNTFSSLAGLAFHWSTVKDPETETAPDSPDRVRLVWFADAEYSPPEYILSMEAEGKQGDVVLVSGLRSGPAKLRVQINEPGYKKVPAAMVRLLILENILLSPPQDLYLLVGAHAYYRVWRRQQGRDTDVQLPSPEFGLQLQGQLVSEAGDPKQPVATIEQESVRVTAVQPGQASLILHYSNIHMQAASQLPNCTIFVVEASFLTLRVHPGEHWVLETGRRYEVTVQVYDIAGNRIHLSDNIKIVHETPVEYLDRLASAENGSWVHARTLQPGATAVRATLVSVTAQNGTALSLNPPISHLQEVHIYSPIVMIPKVLAFPWQPNNGIYRYQIQVEGGSGNFSWSSSNLSVSTVTVKGAVLAGLELGASVIRARDSQNPTHYGETTVYVLRPGFIHLAPHQADVVLGGTLDLPFAVLGLREPPDQEPLPFTDCSLLRLLLHPDRKGVFTLLHGRLHPGPEFCSGFRLEAVSPGHVLLTASSLPEQEPFSASATIATYRPLQPLVLEALVTPGSDRVLLFEGGPRPWILVPSRFYTELRPDSEQGGVWIVQLGQPEVQKNQHGYRVTCTSLGEEWLTFRIGNLPGMLNPRPAEEAVQVKLVCALPASLALSPLLQDPVPSQPCPILQHHRQTVPISSSRDTVLELAAFDQHRTKFDNFSSLLIEWSSSNQSLLSLPTERGLETELRADEKGQLKMHGLQVIKPQRRTGSCTVTASFMSYRHGTSDTSAGSAKDISLPPTSISLELLLVNDVFLQQKSMTLYNHRDVLENLTLTQGSGHFLVRVVDREVVEVTMLEAKNIVQVSPLKPGSSLLYVYDLCLKSSEPAGVALHVSDISDFELEFIHNMEVKKPSPLNVRVLDSSRLPFHSRYFRLMELRVHTAPSIVTVEKIADRDEVTSSYVLQAVSLGETEVFVTARERSGRRLSSSHRHTEVFPRFRLLPRRMTLIIGNSRQVMSEGGPHPWSHIHFSVSSETVAAVTEAGLVTGVSLGSVRVTGAVRTVHQSTGATIEISKDEIEVEVRELRAVRIHAPVTRLRTGTEMPVYVMGSSSLQTPMSFANSWQGLTFHWSQSKRDVLDLVPRHWQTNVKLTPEMNFAMLVRTRTAGRTTLRVTVLPRNHSQPAGVPEELSDEIQILVFQKASLPIGNLDPILMSPNSNFQLETSKDGVGVIQYQVEPCLQGPAVVSVDRAGVLRAHAATGSAILEVTCMEQFGVNQTILVGVKVAPISYLLISSAPELHTADGESLSGFPLGMSLAFQVQFYDCVGDKFRAENTGLGFTSNRDDLLQLGSETLTHTFTAQTTSAGVTVLEAWDPKHPNMADYIAVPTQNAIAPELSGPLTAGDLVCFRTALVNQDGETGSWHVSPSHVLQIDSATGAAAVKDSGTLVVYYKLSERLQTSREVTVRAADSVALTPPADRCLTNSPGSSEYRVTVSIGATASPLKGPCSPVQLSAVHSALRPELDLSCSLQFGGPCVESVLQQAFRVSPHYSTSTGQYSCVVATLPQSDSLLRTLSTASASVLLSASLRWLPQDRPASASIPFQPAFHVSRSALVLNSTHPSAELPVLGSPALLHSLQVWSDGLDVTVGDPVQSLQVPGLLLFSVFPSSASVFQQGADSTARLHLTSAVTGQHVTVGVTVRSDDRAVSGPGWDKCQDSGLFWQLTGSSHLLLFTGFAMLAGTAAVFIVYNAAVNRVRTTLLGYIPTASPHLSGDGLYQRVPYPEPPNQRRRHRWLWST
ncbi:nuclear pore membrane glycoprotein 210-like isoform X2 [Polyodon spathula]|uniref:nuclear pore membrane glycoprotein 210-like isoform X2 n=1 Tax=Polyodon spathula TaxID=7913 RepID=UPI001B7DACBE|nr:nuclear pore membrane glycoprotein 210-like isoform X2 [Polyodon spathula]